MKLSKSARARLKLMTASEKASIRKSARVLFDFGLLSANRMELVARNYK